MSDASQILPILFFGTLLFAAPALVGRFVLKESWSAIGLAFLIWWAGLVVFLGLGAPSLNEVLGWSLIFAMFFSIPGIAVILVIMKMVRRRSQG